MYLYGIEIRVSRTRWRLLICSNCTFMELKFIDFQLVKEHVKVLIVPLWNWNLWLQARQGHPCCSNCTFMELKWFTQIIRNRQQRSSNCTFMELKFLSSLVRFYQKKVLIVPLWNWNADLFFVSPYCPSVLIVPLWNWNLFWPVTTALNEVF